MVSVIENDIHKKYSSQFEQYEEHVKDTLLALKKETNDREEFFVRAKFIYNITDKEVFMRIYYDNEMCNKKRGRYTRIVSSDSNNNRASKKVFPGF